jgi:hypothetical protein
MNQGTETEPSLFIRELIRRVQQELLASREERRKAGEQPIFAVEKMTIEVNFVAEQSKDMKGGLNFKVITIGGVDMGGTRHFQQQQVHKITLVLSALTDEEGGLVGLEDDSPRFLPRERS